jgi:hypothetical protein
MPAPVSQQLASDMEEESPRAVGTGAHPPRLGPDHPGPQHSLAAPSETIAPDGHRTARCPGDGHPAVAVADIDNQPESIDIAVTKARPWRRQVLAGVYDGHLVTDNPSDDRGSF